jgi:hypothetical protein
LDWLAPSEAVSARYSAALRHASIGGANLVTAKKENPAVGTPGQTFVVIGVYGFKYAAWL